MRYRIIFLLFSLLPLVNCSESPELQCVCQGLEISLVYVNSEGVNLIENGTYDFDTIKVNSRRNQLAFTSDRTQNELVFQVIREEGETSYTIDLNGSETDTLILNVTLDTNEDNCCPSDMLNSAVYNGQNQEIINENSVEPPKIIIVKP